MHLKDDELILHYYGENRADRAGASEHLSQCDKCASAYATLEQVLGAMDGYPAPDLPDHFERVVWARLAPALPKQGRGWFSWFLMSPGRLAWMGAILVLVTGAFLAGRMSKPVAQTPSVRVAAPELRERVLLSDLAQHLDKSQEMLVELVTSDGSGTGLAAERGRAEQLVSDNRLYRQTAAALGDSALANVLDDLERVLVDVAASPSVVSAADVAQVRREIDGNGLLFKVRVLSSEVRDRQKAAMLVRAARSS